MSERVIAAPRDASTVVLLRDSPPDSPGGAPEVLLVRRQRGAAFMGDAFVFPGGRIDDADANSHPVTGEDAFVGAAEKQAAMAADRSRAVACGVATLRELFEEAGVLLVRNEEGALLRDNSEEWFSVGRTSVHEATRGFREVLAARDLSLALGELAFFARWVTPETEPKRFDARFFLARMPEGQTAAHSPGELSEHRWATPRAFLDEHTRGAIKLPPPTQWHLGDLAAHATVDAALAWARSQPVATVQPKLGLVDEVLSIVLPWDPAYPSLPGGGAAIDRAHPVAGAITRYVLSDGSWVGRAL
ncbi:MAG: hypothetical protein EXR72_10245 [Myxococcales bacterium]|nr:hypothetical protein [Myxococcales bacterium]